MTDNSMLNVVERRRGLLKYALYHYLIDQKETVWVLNFLKDHRVLEHFVFVSPAGELSEGLTLTHSHQLLFHYKGRIIAEADVIFHLLNEIEGEFYFYFAFHEPKFNELQYYERLVALIDRRQMPDSFAYLNPLERQRLAEIISEKVDMSLLLHDKDDFDYFSTIIKKLKD